MEERIPKIVHYCWFGKGDTPEIVNKCIESWKAKLKDFEIIEWNEENFDVNINDYVKEAYQNKKYAFVSDYVRLYALYNMGGIYLDTDTEVIKSLDEFLDEDSFWGFEEKNYIATSTIGAKKGNRLIKIFLDFYEDKSFNVNKKKLEITTNVQMVTKIFRDLGFKTNGEKQTIKGIGTIYPQEYFSPYDYINFIDKSNDNTYTKHHFYKSWIPITLKLKIKLKKALIKIIGVNGMNKIRMIREEKYD